MAPSDETRHRADKAAAAYDAHLEAVEDKMEASAHEAETSFRDHTAVPEADLERAEDEMEAAARKADARAAEHDARVRERIAHAREDAPGKRE